MTSTSAWRSAAADSPSRMEASRRRPSIAHVPSEARSQKSVRGDKTEIELFVRGLAGWTLNFPGTR